MFALFADHGYDGEWFLGCYDSIERAYSEAVHYLFMDVHPWQNEWEFIVKEYTPNAPASDLWMRNNAAEFKLSRTKPSVIKT